MPSRSLLRVVFHDAKALCRAALACALLLSVGCGSEGGGGGAVAPDASGSASAAKPVNNGLVAAVAVDGSTAAATLRFEVLDRPQSGLPFNLRLQLQPTQTLTLLQADLVDGEGVRRLVAPNLIRLVGAAATGLPERTVAMQADQAGIFEIRIVVKTESTGGAGLSQFVLPVLVEAAPQSQ
jgi:hypothetical protein